MLFRYTKYTVIKAIKMIVINSKMRGKKEEPIKIDQIGKVVDRWFFVCLNWVLPNRYTYPL